MVQTGEMLPEAVVPLRCVFLEAQALLPQTAFMGEEPVPVPPGKWCGREMDVYTQVYTCSVGM